MKRVSSFSRRDDNDDDKIFSLFDCLRPQFHSIFAQMPNKLNSFHRSTEKSFRLDFFLLFFYCYCRPMKIIDWYLVKIKNTYYSGNVCACSKWHWCDRRTYQVWHITSSQPMPSKITGWNFRNANDNNNKFIDLSTVLCAIGMHVVCVWVSVSVRWRWPADDKEPRTARIRLFAFPLSSFRCLDQHLMAQHEHMLWSAAEAPCANVTANNYNMSLSEIGSEFAFQSIWWRTSSINLICATY